MLDPSTDTILDASVNAAITNFAKKINDPLLKDRWNVATESDDNSVYVYALKDIQANEELGMEYGESYWSKPSMFTKLSTEDKNKFNKLYRIA